MTPEEQIHRTYELFNEHGGFEAVEELWHPDIEYHEAFDWPGAGTYRGREAVRARFTEYLEALGIVRADLDRVVGSGDRLAWTVRFEGRSAAGVPNAHTWGYIGRFEDGLLVRCWAYYAASEALDELQRED
jgi:ketosteroid isomerase-like protein